VRVEGGSQSYRIEYRAERMVEAPSIKVAIQQAEALGVSDIVSITRED
jgi:hypothetical protein